MASHRQVHGAAEADMTPMIDVVFLLIVFFLCIDFKTLEARLPAYLPRKAGSHDVDAPVEQLSVKIVCTDRGTEVPREPSAPEIGPDGGKNPYRLEGHSIHWLVGPKRYAQPNELRAALESIANDPSKLVYDEGTGRTQRMPVVIEPTGRTVYGDVAATVDAVTDAGFTAIQFGGGRRR